MGVCMNFSTDYEAMYQRNEGENRYLLPEDAAAASYRLAIGL